MINQRQQHGVTLIGMMFWAIAIVFAALVVMKLLPAYTEFFEIQKILKDIGNESSTGSMSNAQIRERFAKRAMVDNITMVKPADININRESGRTVVSVDYSFQAPLVGNVSLLVDFSASSDSSGKQAQQVE
jgi:hypothetical protein